MMIIRTKVFPETLRRRVVEAIESGKTTAVEVKRRYHIHGHSTILKWCRRYGRDKYPVTYTRSTLMITGEQKNTRILQNKIRLLERELNESRLKQATLETLIEIAEETHSITIKKNFGGKRLKE
jgi:transposase